MNENEEEIEIKLNKERQKLIRLIAVKDNKTFSKSKKENYKIGAVISNQKWKNYDILKFVRQSLTNLKR